MLLPNLSTANGFDPESKVWVYVASRPLTPDEATVAQEAVTDFVRQWTAHNQALHAAAEVFQNQFIILLVDETHAGASGCSIDKSVHFLEMLGQRLGVDFFERMRFAWVSGSTLAFGDRQEFSAAVHDTRITGDTLVVNTLVQNKRDLQEKWLVPYSQSWHRRLV